MNPPDHESLQVQIARLEEALKNTLNRLQTISEAYAPTNKQVIENALKIRSLEEDVKEILGRMDRFGDRFDKWARNADDKVAACAAANGELEKRLTKDREYRQEKERADRIARNRWAIGLAAAFLTMVASIYLGSAIGG